MSTALERVLAALTECDCAPRRVGTRWAARCPAHADRRPSLSVGKGKDGRALLRCWAGCDTGTVLMAIGLDWSALFEHSASVWPSRVSDRRSRPLYREANRAPVNEVRVIWACCSPVHEDVEVARWIAGRGLDPFTLADRDLCRALPPNVALPRWAWCRGHSWTRAGYRLIVPLHDHRGAILSLHARNVSGDEPKGALPAGYSARGLVFADDVGRQFLRSGTLDEGSVWVSEGVPDFLTCSTAWADSADTAPAVIGVLSGSWTHEIAARVPDRVRVVIAVHHDSAGEHYLAQVAHSLGGRCDLQRWTPKGLAS